jgi:hypothetical protein
VPFALRQRLLFHQLFRGAGVILIVAPFCGRPVDRFRPAILRWWESRRR